MHFQKTELEAERVGQAKDHLLNDLSVEASGIHGEGESMVPLVSVSKRPKMHGSQYLRAMRMGNS